ncbi:retrovirus-related Pol polyprotein from transposon TNT 1-94 [Senna tora]|uniref:Retrovirus-related Pol polyprotein from transposon TNT 1-94 n=1 Tax=Senna tora TaxID=362788 RepID=A0A834TJA7_9FABA|nr:retrovirus-related Pol polyprotein from transposon TNT 1-94 [Senna tora]
MTTGKESADKNLPQRKTISPYDITSLDNPGLLITQVQLKGNNYAEWACNVKTTLRVWKKFGFINGTISQPPDESVDLDEQRGVSISDYYGRLEQLWEEMFNYEILLTCECTCGKCSCNLATMFAKKREDDKVHMFLLGLDANLYGIVQSSILAQELLPNVKKVYSILVQEECIENFTRSKEE